MLQVPRRVEYALRAVLALARAADGSVGGRRLSFKDIAESEDIPRDYLAKILRTLVDAGIVDSRRGARGGYTLARPASSVTFLEVIEAADSPLAVNLCTDHGAGCSQSTTCAMTTVWQSAEDAMRGVLAQTTIDSVMARPLSLTQLTRSAARCNDHPDCPCGEFTVNVSRLSLAEQA